MYTLEDDVSTLDGIIQAYYEVVSAAAGEARDWARDSSLHAVDARVVVTGKRSDGMPFANILTLAQYHANSGTVAKQGFFEDEIHRETQRFGNIAHVWSTYAWRRTADGPVEGRGINSIQLYHDGGSTRGSSTASAKTIPYQIATCPSSASTRHAWVCQVGAEVSSDGTLS
ncbi:MAG: hypothetical protein RhofKO_19110 [Rhodothermales bacterium]